MKHTCTKLCVLLIIATLTFCKKEIKVSTLTVDTESVDEITGTSANVGGRVNSDGSSEVTDRGVYWGTSAKPETTGTKLQSGSGPGIFHETLAGLSPGIKYYVTAYAVNSSETVYGSETFFTTQISMPVVSTSKVTEYTATSAKVGGEVTANGGFDITERGIFWGVEPNPRLTGIKVIIGGGMGVFNKNMEGLSRAYTYYVVAFATNLKGTSYGEEVNFKTEPEKPVIYTSPVTGITTHAANTGGSVSSDGGTEVTERGVWWGTSPDPVLTGSKLPAGSGKGNFITHLELDPGKTYYVRAYAINSVGTSYGEEKTFTTLGAPPKTDTVCVKQLFSDRVKISVQIDSSDLNTTLWIEYGLTDSYGNLTSQITIPARNNKDTTIYIDIAGLSVLEYYHFRAVASNALGEVRTKDHSFRTVCTGRKGTITIDGIDYSTIGIGYQEWITTNLRSVADISGDSIPAVDSLWVSGIPSRSWYGGDKNNAPLYGALYNWNAVKTYKLCPAEWSIPSKTDIENMISYIGADSAGLKLREAGISYWSSSAGEATNIYGFNARGGGKRYMDSSYDMLKVEGNWWIKDEYSSFNAMYFSMMYDRPNIFVSYFDKKTGMSVRCVKNH